MGIPLLLLAASGLAREVIEVLDVAGRYDVLGCLDDDPDRHGEKVNGVGVIGDLTMVADFPDAKLLLCAGPGRARRAIADRVATLTGEQAQYATVVDPGVRLPASAQVGAGSILLAGCVITAQVEIGRHVVCMPNVTLTHDVVLESFATVCAGVSLGGGVTVQSGAYLGMNSSVRQGVTIGQNAVIGMGAVVLDDVAAEQTWAGVPARPIKR